jgi:hypothetical protein
MAGLGDVSPLLVPYLTLGQSVRLFSCCKVIRDHSKGDKTLWAYYHSLIGLSPLSSSKSSWETIGQKVRSTNRCCECGVRTRSRVVPPGSRHSGPRRQIATLSLCVRCSEEKGGYRKLVSRKEIKEVRAEKRRRGEPRSGRILPVEFALPAKVSQSGAFLYWPSSFPDVSQLLTSSC